MAALAIRNPGGHSSMPRQSMPINDKVEILQAIGGVNETVVGLRSDMSNMRDKLEELGRKVDKVEELKASRPELEAVEARGERALEQSKTQMKIDLDQHRMQSKLDFEQFRVHMGLQLDGLRKDKLDKTEISSGTVESILERVGNVESKAATNETRLDGWKNRAEGGWIVLCKVGIVVAAIISSIAYAVHEFLAITKH